jgi:hypothetical protein
MLSQYSQKLAAVEADVADAWSESCIASQGMEELGALAEAASDIEKANGLLPKLSELTRVLKPLSFSEACFSLISLFLEPQDPAAHYPWDFSLVETEKFDPLQGRCEKT